MVESSALQSAKNRLRRCDPNPGELKQPPSALPAFTGPWQTLSWKVIEPCRVSPVWLSPPSLPDFPEETVGRLQAALATQGHHKSKLLPLVAGYSGAQPLRLSSSRGDFFVKAVLKPDSETAVFKLGQEIRVMEALRSLEVTPRLIDRCVSGTGSNVAFFISEFSAASPLESEPFLSESRAWAEQGQVGPFLTSWLHLLRSFHHLTPVKQPFATPSRMHGIDDWHKALAQASEKQLIADSERALLGGYLDRITAAFQLRAKSAASLFLHGDMHASNVRWDAAKQQLIAIDFGESGLGDPARELAYFFFMMDAPMRLAAPLTQLYRRDVLPLNQAFYERTLLALAGERIGRYLKILRWSGKNSNAAQSYERQIIEDHNFVSSWV